MTTMPTRFDLRAVIVTALVMIPVVVVAYDLVIYRMTDARRFCIPTPASAGSHYEQAAINNLRSENDSTLIALSPFGKPSDAWCRPCEIRLTVRPRLFLSDLYEGRTVGGRCAAGSSG